MKSSKKKMFLVFILVFFCLIKASYAETRYITLIDAVNIRKGPGTTYGVLSLEQVGSSYNLKNADKIADEGKNGKCDSGWYEIDYKGTSGYVCSDYVNLYIANESDTGVPSTTCEKEMQAAGFPSSYWSGLCSLKKSYPTWSFKAIQTNLDFTTAVNKFTNCSDALLQKPKAEWQDTTCSYREGDFQAVNQTAVAYYLDPRNFFNERYIFQFEDSKYNQNLTNNYADASRSIINGANFYKYHLGLGTDLALLIATGGQETNVSSTHLASRMYQELGGSTLHKNLYQGVFEGEISYAPINPLTGNHRYDFRGYYNFYNIGVTGSCVNGGGGATYCGLNKAISYGWNSVAKAVAGGGSFLTSNYINQGQYTPYLERFNVVPTQSKYMYVHYYMANLAAPTSESTLTYNAYKSNNLLNSSFVFYIPVYSNMGADINNSGNGAVDEGSSSSPSTTEIATILTSAGYKTSGSTISGINPKTDIDTFIKSIEAVGGTATIVKNAISKTNYVGTGYQITIKNASESKTYTAIVRGDTSGNGEITIEDLLQIQRQILGDLKLTNEYLTAGDTSKSDGVTSKDLLQVRKYLLGEYTIEQ